MTHGELVLKAERWLKSQGCGVVFRDGFKALTHNRELPDAIGWREGISILIECKASRADFLADKGKMFRQDPAVGMGDWRFFLCPPDIITADDLPTGWGLLYAHQDRVKKIHGAPASNCSWWTGKPFEGNKRCETQMMYSALRRMVVRGHFDTIYEGIPKGL